MGAWCLGRCPQVCDSSKVQLSHSSDYKWSLGVRAHLRKAQLHKSAAHTRGFPDPFCQSSRVAGSAGNVSRKGSSSSSSRAGLCRAVPGPGCALPQSSRCCGTGDRGGTALSLPADRKQAQPLEPLSGFGGAEFEEQRNAEGARLLAGGGSSLCRARGAGAGAGAPRASCCGADAIARGRGVPAMCPQHTCTSP